MDNDLIVLKQAKSDLLAIDVLRQMILILDDRERDVIALDIAWVFD